MEKKGQTLKEKQREEQFRRLQSASAAARSIKEAMIMACADAEEAMAIEARPLNWFILEFIYMKENPGCADFKTFMEWKGEGYSVKKGARGFPVWSRPKRSERKGERQREDGTTEEVTLNGPERFHMAYLFSNLQVEREKED